ncbi:MAG: PAS domain S-box protein, partial [Vicinamibacterales bacterium]
GAVDLLEVLQDTVRRSERRPVLVLADSGDRAGATAAFRLGASQVIAKNGAWPIRLAAAIEQTVAARRSEAERERLAASDERHRALIETLPIGVLVLDAHGVLQSVNAAGLALTGSAPQDSIVGTALLDHIADAHRDRVRSLIAAAATGQAGPIRVLWQIGNTERSIELTASRLSTGAQNAMTLVSVNAVSAEPAAAPADAATGVDPDEHAALQAHFEAAAHEANMLRDQLAHLEAEQAAFSGRMETEVAALQDLFSQVAKEAEAHGGLGLENASREIARLDTALGEAEVALAAASEAHAREIEQLRAMLSDTRHADETEAALESETLRRQLTDALDAVRLTEETLKAEVERYRHQRDDALMALQEAEARHEQAIRMQRRQFDELQDAYARMEESWKTARTEVDQLAGRAHYDVAASADQEHRIAALSAEAEEARAGVAAQGEALKALHGRVEELAAALQKAEYALTERTRELADANATLLRLRTDHDSAIGARAQEVVALCSALDAAEQTRAALVSEHGTELDSLRAAFSERESDYRRRIAQLEGDLALVRQQLVGAVTVHEREELRRQIENLSGALEKAQASLVERVRDVESARRRTADLESSLERAKQERSQVEAQLRRAIDDRDATIALGAAQQTALQRRLESVATGDQRWFDTDLLGMAVTDASGEILRVNATFGRLFGDAGRQVLQHIPDAWQRLVALPESIGATILGRELPVIEGTVTLPSGRQVWYAESGRLVTEASGRQVLERGFVDTTARHQLEVHQREQRGVEAVGRVAGDFVKEIDHRVSEAQEIARDVLERTDATDHRTAALRALIGKTDDVHDVTRQFLAFSRGRLRMPDWLVLSELLQSLQPLLQHLTGEGIALTVEPAPHALSVNAPREPLVRMLLSLVTAAADALPLGGHITVGLVPAGAAGHDMSVIAIHVNGFGQRELKGPATVDTELEAVGASLRTVNDDQPRRFELTVRTLRQVGDSTVA